MWGLGFRDIASNNGEANGNHIGMKSKLGLRICACGP